MKKINTFLITENDYIHCIFLSVSTNYKLIDGILTSHAKYVDDYMAMIVKYPEIYEFLVNHRNYYIKCSRIFIIYDCYIEIGIYE